jgi:hypothetical protein
MKPPDFAKTSAQSRATLPIPADMVIETFPPGLIVPIRRYGWVMARCCWSRRMRAPRDM